MKRAIALMIVLIMLFTMIACTGDVIPTPDSETTETTGGEENKTPDASDSGDENDGENEKEETKDPVEPVEPDFDLVKDDVANFVIVSRKNDYDALAESLATQLTQKTGAVFVAKDKKAKEENAIFIGWAPKNLMTSDLDALTYDGYVFRMLDGSLHITAYTKENIEKALKLLVDSITEDRFEMQNGKLSIMAPGALLKIHNPTYPKRDATLLGKPISDFEIVLPKDYTVIERFAADEIVDKIGKSTGYKLDYIKDSSKQTKPYRIVFGKTALADSATVYDGLAKNSYCIKNSGSNLYVAYDNYLVATEIAEALEALCVKNSSASVQQTKTFDYSQYRVEKNAELISELGMQENRVVRIMTSNIVAPGDENGQTGIEKKYGVTWQERMKIQGEMIMLYKPDFVGFQELQEGVVNSVNALGITELLKTIGSEYDMVFYDNVPINVHHTPIAYRKDVWQVEEKLASEKLSSNAMHRWQWARFSMIDDPETAEDESEIQYIIMNLHYPITTMSEERKIAGKAVHDEFLRLKELYPDIPISITGDFNAAFGSDLYNRTIGADEEGIADTDLKTSYLTTSDKLGGYASIDHVLVENDDVTVLNYRVVKNGLLYATSDHSPVFVDVYMGKVIVPTPGPDVPWDDGTVQTPNS